MIYNVQESTKSKKRKSIQPVFEPCVDYFVGTQTLSSKDTSHEVLSIYPSIYLSIDRSTVQQGLKTLPSHGDPAEGLDEREGPKGGFLGGRLEPSKASPVIFSFYTTPPPPPPQRFPDILIFFALDVGDDLHTR
jgi:hypothetical protein